MDFLAYLLGLRQPRSTVTTHERSLLVDLSRGKQCVVEVGVFEGATSVVLADAIAASGRVWLVDPFWRGTRPERLLRFSFSEYIARRTVRRCAEQVRFVRLPSTVAAQQWAPGTQADLVFIDADHSYDAVLADFIAWSARLGPDGVVAFHDSRLCAARPDLPATAGPVRLVNEVLRGVFGPWTLVGSADSVTAFRKDRDTR